MNKIFTASIGNKQWEIIASSKDEAIAILFGEIDISDFPVSIYIDEKKGDSNDG